MKWRNTPSLLFLFGVFSCVDVLAKQVLYPTVSDVEKPRKTTIYTADLPTKKTHLAIQPSVLTSQRDLEKTHRVLSNDYPLTQTDKVPAKRKVKARYSENGIVSDLGVEKRKVYQYQQTNGVMVFSDQKPQDDNYQILLYECFACRPDSTIDWYKIPLFTSYYKKDVVLAAKKYQLDPALIRAVIHAESAFKEQAISKAGAMGLMQLMPRTAEDMGVENAFVAQQNIRGGSRYLAQLLAQFNGDIDLACAAYNAGPATVLQYNGVPPYPETQAYVTRVKILFKRYQKALAS